MNKFSLVSMGVSSLAVFVGITIPLSANGMEQADLEEPSHFDLIERKGWVSAGIFFADFNTTARLDASSGSIGTSIDLEDDFGMDTSTEVYVAQAGVYFSKRWRFEAEYMQHSRWSVSEVEREFDWGDQTIDAGFNAISAFELDITRIAVGFDFYEGKNHLVGVSAGLHWVKLFAGIEGEGTISGNLPVSDPGFTRFDFTFDSSVVSEEKLPLPNFGFYTSSKMGERWRFVSRLDFFMLSMGEWGGDFLSASAQLKYLIHKNFYVAAGMQYMVVNVKYDTRLLDGRIHYRHFGPRLDVGFRF